MCMDMNSSEKVLPPPKYELVKRSIVPSMRDSSLWIADLSISFRWEMDSSPEDEDGGTSSYY